MSSLLRLEQQQKKTSKKCIPNSHISLSFLLIWKGNDKYVHTLPWLPRKPYPISDQNGAKTKPFGAAHTYVADIRSKDVKGTDASKRNNALKIMITVVASPELGPRRLVMVNFCRGEIF